MNAYFFKMTNEERSNILDQHKEIYDGYVTSYAQQPNQQPLYVQDYANDKGGLTVNNRGEVSTYKNVGINEMRHDGKSTGLFSDEEPKEGYISAGVEYAPEETFEGLHDMIGDGEDDLEHGTFDDDDSDDEYLRRKSGEGRDFDDDDEFMDDDYDFGFESPSCPSCRGNGCEECDGSGMKRNSIFKNDELQDDSFIFDDDSEIFKGIDEDETEGLFDDLRESLDMFKRFTKYN
jgi:hypothetical protein